MNSRYAAAKLFFVLAGLCALVGAVRFRSGTIGQGLTGADYLNPLYLIDIPRLIPFAAAILSACFGLVYLGLEKKIRRRLNVSLTLVHMIAYLLLILGHVTLVNFWWRVLGEEQATNLPMPLWAGTLEIVSGLTCCLAFAANIVWSFWKIPSQDHLASGSSTSRV